jgi:hypothetical protein
MNKEDAILDMLELLHRELRDLGDWPDDSGEYDPINVLREQIKAAAADSKDQQRWDDIQKGLAKGLPELTKGIINASKSFQSGDAFSGSAAIMDICATLTSTIAAMAPAAGPPGALIAAIFSIVSMILNCFAPKAESLTSQLEKLMRDLNAEEKTQQIEAAQLAIRVYAEAVKSAERTSLKKVVKMFNPVEGNTIWAIRQVGLWLGLRANQGLKGWPQVLAAQCQAYADLVRVAHQDMAKLKLSPEEEAAGLKSGIGAFLTAVTSNHSVQAEFLQRMLPVARNRGTVWHLGTGGPALHARDAVVGKEDWKHFGGQHRVFTVARTKGAEASPTPTLAIFGLETGDYVNADPNKPFWRNNRTYSLCGRWPLDGNDGWKQVKDQKGDLTGCYDIFAIPGDKKDEIYAYSANGDRTIGYVHDHTDHDKAGDRLAITRVWEDTSWPAGYLLGAIKVVGKPKPFPDEDAAVLKDVGWIQYVGCEVPAGRSTLADAAIKNTAHVELYAKFHGTGTNVWGHSFMAPWNDYVGFAVDSQYLWVFRSGEIACASHWSIKRCVDAQALRPAWMTYAIPESVGGYTPAGRSLGGLVDLWPSDDGTLTAAFSRVAEFPSGIVPGLIPVRGLKPAIYTMTPEIDRTKRTLTMKAGSKAGPGGFDVPTHGWTTDDGATAFKVVKQPIFCWRLMSALLTSLEDVIEGRESVKTA